MQSFPFEWVPNQHNTSLYCLTNPDVVKTIAIQSPVKPNDSYRSLIYALTIPIAVLDILGFILFTSLHNRFLLIKARPIYMNLIMAIASFVWNLLIMKIEISGRHSVPCPAFISTAYLTFGVTLSLLPLWLILYVVRLIEAKIYVHFTIQSNGGDSTIAQQQQQQNNIIGRTKKAYNLYHQTPRLLDTLQLLLTSSNGEINVEKLVKKIEGYETDNAIVPVSDGEVKSRSSGGHRSHLPTLCGINLFELWSEFLLPSYFLIFGLIPTIIALFVRIYASPWMARDCFGCEFEMLDVYLIGTSGAIAAIIVLSIIWLARREPDPLGVKQELLIMLCLCAPLGVLTFLLLFSYPAPHQSYTFSYYLLSDLAIFFVYL